MFSQFSNEPAQLQGLAPALGLIHKWEVRWLTELQNWKGDHKGHLNPIYNNPQLCLGTSNDKDTTTSLGDTF